MKKVICELCGERRGKRLCAVRGRKMICATCCATIRNQDCAGCPHYAAAQGYAASKTSRPPVEQFCAVIDPEVENEVDRALDLVEKGNLKKGEALISDLHKRHPENHKVCFAMGVVYALKGEHNQAIEYFDKAISIYPYFLEAHFNRAAAFKEKLDLINSIKSFRRVVELGDPGDALVRQAREFIGNTEREFRKKGGMDLDSYLELGETFLEACSRMENREWEKAIAGFQSCLRKNQRHVQSFGNLGICYAQMGQKEKALCALDQAIRLDSAYEPARTNRALIEALEEGEELGGEVEIVEYYKERVLGRKR